MATQKKSNMPLYGTKGNDKLTVTAKLHVEVFAYAGNDTITVTRGKKHKIYAGAGKDKITVKTGTSVDVYGDASNSNSNTTKGGKDTITVNGGKSINVYGEIGNDVITVKKGTNFKILGGAGTDTIKVHGGSGHRIYGDYDNSDLRPKSQKKDNIYIYGGSFDKIDGGGGGDKITVSKKAKGGKVYDSAIIEGGAGGDTITVSAGTYYKIYGDVGADKITLKNSKSSAEVYGEEGNDTITVSNSNNTLIDGGDGNDTITVTGGTDNVIKSGEGNHIINVTSHKSSGGYKTITCSSGSDTITLTKCSGCEVDPGGGANKITIDGCQNIKIDYGSIDYNGDDIIDIKGGTGHVVKSSYGGNITVSGSGTTCDATIWYGDGSATLKAGSKTKLSFWSYDSGKFTINADKGALTGDLITFIWNSYDQFKFCLDGSALTLTGKNGACSLRINNFDNGAFAGGITFSGKNYSYDTIMNKALES